MTRVLTGALLLIAIFLTDGGVTAAAAFDSRPGSIEAAEPGDRILLRPRADADRGALSRLYASLGCRVIRSFPDLRDITVLEVQPGRSVAEIVEALRRSGLVEYAEPDSSARALMSPNDPLFTSGQQWALKNTGAGGGIAGADIMAEQAWDVIRDASSIVVAVVDSGIRYTHQDLAANMWVNPGEIPANGIDDDRNGYVDDVHGVNVLNGSGDPNDDWGHGSHVAGVVGAVGNNGVGMSGIAWRVKLMAVKFIRADASYSVSDAVTALAYARRMGARVVTGAWGGYSFDSAALRDAVMALRDANIILAAAAGNDGSNNDSRPLFPASYTYSNVISTAATDRSDGRWGSSNYGAASVDLGAPGADILSCWAGSNSDYAAPSGTSMASAHVAGACALLWARSPGDSHTQIINRILSTVDPLPGLSGLTVSGGRLNLAAAITGAILPNRPVVTSAGTASGTVGSPFSFQITATNSPTSFGIASGTLPSGLVLNTGSGVISGTPNASGTSTVNVTATNAGGTSAPAALTITINAVSTPVPTITSATTAEGTVGVGFAYQITATNSPTSYSATNLTGTGLSLNTSTGLISGTPGSAGTITTQIRAANGSGTSAAVTLTITVAAGVPSVTSATSAAATVGVGFSYQITASNSPTSYSATNLAGTGLSLNTSTGLISGTPTAAGPISSQLRATNSTGTSAPVTLTITVGAATPVPTITSATTANATVGVGFAYQITATNSPTRYAATNLAGTGLTLNTSTGVISGTPTTQGTINSQLTASNSSGTSAPRTLTITVSPAPLPRPVVTSATVNGTEGAALSFTVSATNSPTHYALSGQPPGVAINTTSGVISGTPGSSGTFRATVTATNSSGSGTGTITFEIAAAPQASQTITFPVPSGVKIGTPVQLAATASSGLPVTYSLVSGSATLSGNMLTITGTGSVIVRATQSGNGSWLPATAQITLSAEKAAQTINVGALPGQLTTDAVLVIDASATSGLPLTYTLVSGPASLVGNTLTCNGATGTVVVRISQPGNSAYNAASDVVLSFEVIAAGPQIYFGKLGSDDIAVVVPPDGTLSTLLVRIGSTGDAAVAKFTPAHDGAFVAHVATLGSDRGPEPAGGVTTQEDATGLTFSGIIRDGLLSGRCEELGINFSAVIQPASGSNAARAGLYVAPVAGSASGVTYLVVAATGKAYSLVSLAPVTTFGNGSVTASGDFSLPLSGGGLMSGVVEPSRVSGSLTVAGTTLSIAGIGPGVTATDRLVNISSRLTVTGTDSSRASIAGFVVSGTTPRRILIRAVGPTLQSFGLGTPVSAPRLQVYNSAGTLLAENSGWGSDPAITSAGDSIGAFRLIPGSRDAALIISLPTGTYTAVVSSSDTGVALVEVYDLSANEPAQARHLINLSTRGFVGVGENALIGGFVVAGNTPKRVLIRAIGPSLGRFGVSGALQDPLLKVYNGGSVLVAQNDNWGVAQSGGGSMPANSAEITAASAASGAFPLTTGTRDAVVLTTLVPGSYSAVVTGAGNTTGAALVEVYEVPME